MRLDLKQRPYSELATLTKSGLIVPNNSPGDLRARMHTTPIWEIPSVLETGF